MDEAGQGIVLSSPPKCGVTVARVGLIDRSHSPLLPRVSFKRHFGALMTQALGAERGTPDWRWPPTSGSGPLALATPCAQVPGRYDGPSNFQSRVAHPWSWDIGPLTSAAQTSLNMVHSRQKARPLRAHLAAHGSVDLGGAALAIETGADFAIGSSPPLRPQNRDPTPVSCGGERGEQAVLRHDAALRTPSVKSARTGIGAEGWFLSICSPKTEFRGA